MFGRYGRYRYGTVSVVGMYRRCWYLPLGENRGGIAEEALPFLTLVDLGKGGPAQVALDAPLAEGIGALVAADEVTAVGAPAAVAVRPLLVLLPLTLVLVEVFAAATHRHAQVGMSLYVVLYVVIHLDKRKCRKITVP